MSNSITLYGLKNCDSCRKALKILRYADFVDIRGEAELTQKVPFWLDHVGPEILVNQRSTTWRELDASERKIAPIELLIRFPTLIKRPVIEANGRVYVGWTTAIQNELHN